MSTHRPSLKYYRRSSRIDVSKTATYIWLDLAAKVVSAVALVALGLAGWLLQSNTQAQHDETDRLERQERRYLPMLRSLTELQLSLETTAAVARITEEPFYQISPEYKDYQLRELGLRVRYTSLSVFTPDKPFIISIRPAFAPWPTTIRLSLTDACDILSGLLYEYTYLKTLPADTTVNASRDGAAILLTSASGSREIFTRKGSEKAWTVWLGTRPQPVRVLLRYPQRLAEDIGVAISQIVHETIRRHPDLGTSFVAIRNDVYKNEPTLRQQPLPSTKGR